MKKVLFCGMALLLSAVYVQAQEPDSLEKEIPDTIRYRPSERSLTWKGEGYLFNSKSEGAYYLYTGAERIYFQCEAQDSTESKSEELEVTIKKDAQKENLWFRKKDGSPCSHGYQPFGTIAEMDIYLYRNPNRERKRVKDVIKIKNGPQLYIWNPIRDEEFSLEVRSGIDTVSRVFKGDSLLALPKHSMLDELAVGSGDFLRFRIDRKAGVVFKGLRVGSNKNLIGGEPEDMILISGHPEVALSPEQIKDVGQIVVVYDYLDEKFRMATHEITIPIKEQINNWYYFSGLLLFLAIVLLSVGIFVKRRKAKTGWRREDNEEIVPDEEKPVPDKHRKQGKDFRRKTPGQDKSMNLEAKGAAEERVLSKPVFKEQIGNPLTSNGTKEPEKLDEQKRLDAQNEPMKLAGSTGSEVLEKAGETTKLNGAGISDPEVDARLKKLGQQLKEISRELETSKKLVKERDAQLQVKNEKLDDQSRKLQSLNDRYKMLESQKKLSDECCERLGKEASELKKDNVHLEDELNEVNGKLDRAIARKNELQNQVNSLRADLDARAEENRKHIEELRSLHQEEIAGINEECERRTRDWRQDKEVFRTQLTVPIERLAGIADDINRNIDGQERAIAESFDYITNHLALFAEKITSRISDQGEWMKCTNAEAENTLQKEIVELIRNNSSWINSIARLYCYSRIPEIARIFEDNEVRVDDVDSAYMDMVSLLGRCGLIVIVPRILVDYYDDRMKKYFQYNNEDITISRFVGRDILVRNQDSLKIYDMGRISYILDGHITKGQIVYF